MKAASTTMRVVLIESDACILFADSSSGPMFLRLLGRFHPAVTHFPIALVTLAAVLETWQLARRRPKLAVATPVCRVVGAVAAILASVFGLLRNEYDGPGGNTVELHKWAGLATTLFAVLSALLLTTSKASSSTIARTCCRLTAFAAAVLAGGVGFLGGEMVLGRNHLTRGLLDAERPALPSGSEGAVLGSRGTNNDSGQSATPVDFARDIAPVLSENCLKCHGRGKINGKLNLTTRAGAVQGGGDEGVGLVPGQPGKSSIYSKLTAADADIRMPPPGQKPLTNDQIDLIRRWIEQGANWPDDAVLR